MESDTRRLFVLGAISQYLSYFVGLLTYAVTVPVYLHFLGQDAYGLFVSLSSIISYFLLLDVGIGLTVPKYVAEYSAKNEKEKLEKMLSSFLLIYLVAFILALAAGFAIAPIISKLLRIPDDLVQAGRLALILLAANMGILMIAGLFTSIFTGMRKVYIKNLFGMGQILGVAALSITVLWLGGGLVGICVAMVTVSLLQFVLAFALARRRYTDLRIKLGLADWGMFREIAFPTLNYFILQIVALIVLSTDNIVIGAFIGVGAVVPYAIAFRFCRYLTSLTWIPSDVLYPFFSDWYARGRLDDLRNNHRRLMKLTTIFAVLVTIFTIFFGQELIRLWVGSKNYVGDPTLYLFCAIIITSSIVHVSGIVLTGMGKHAPIAYMGLFEATINLVLSIIFVHYWGVFGVALGTIIAGSITAVWFSPWYTCKILEDHFLSLIVREIAPALLSGSIAVATNYILLAYILPEGILLRVIAGSLCCILYLLIVMLFLKKEELIWLHGIVKSVFALFRHKKEPEVKGE